MRYAEIVAEAAQSKWPERLNSGYEIADYIERIAGSPVDRRMLDDFFRGATAELKLVDINSIQAGGKNSNVKVRGRDAEYARMPLETMPPLVVEGGKVVDGNHRYRVAKKLGATQVWVYEVT